MKTSTKSQKEVFRKPSFISPQLATLWKKKPFSDKDWIFEVKLDGIRCIAVRDDGNISLFSRNHKSLNKDFPEIVSALKKTSCKSFVIDGELVAFERNVTSFSKLQQRKQKKIKAFYYLFDALVLGDKDLRKCPLIERKRLLKKHISFGGVIRFTSHIARKGKEFYKKAAAKGLEGIIAKKAKAPYQSKRTTTWLKFKCMRRQEFVIGGYTKPEGSRVGFGALLIGYYTKKGLHYAGKVGTGYNTSLLQSLGKTLERLQRKQSPFITKPKEKGVYFVRPTLVCEVSFTEWTGDKKLRHPSFLGLRKDKSAKEVKRE